MSIIAKIKFAFIRWRFNRKYPYLAGADPTGVNDSTKALMAACDATTAGGVLYIPPGKYRWSNKLSIERKADAK